MGYIELFQGTPLLMQLFPVYHGVALLGIDVSAWLAVTIAFRLHASAFLGEIWRGSIQAVPKGQTEAANALGLHYVSRMKDVILPQALKISLPATIGFLVQLIKGTSLAAIVGFVELARAGQIVSNQTYRPLLVFGIVGAIYFVICWPLSHFGAALEKRMAKATRSHPTQRYQRGGNEMQYNRRKFIGMALATTAWVLGGAAAASAASVEEVKAKGTIVVGIQFYGQRLEAAAPGTYERKIDFLTTYNGVGTRLGEKDWNETVNAFLDKIKANGELAAITRKWMGIDLLQFPESIPNIPFTVN